MKIRDLLELPMREVLENYRAMVSHECGYCYGIFKDEDINKIFDKYDVDEDYSESFVVENLISDEVIVSYDDDIGDYAKMEQIVKSLGINEKTQ